MLDGLQNRKGKKKKLRVLKVQEHSSYIKMYVLTNIGNPGTIYKIQNNGHRNAERGPSQLPGYLTLSYTLLVILAMGMEIME